MKDLFTVISILQTKEKKFFTFLIFLTIFSGLLETISIGLIFPLIKILVDGPEVLLNLKFLMPFNTLILSFSKEFLFIICFIILLLIIFIKNTFLVYLYYLYFKFSASVSIRLANDLITNIINKDYIFFLSEKSSENANALINEINLYVKSCLETLCVMLTELIILFSILSFLFFLQPDGTLIIFIITVISTLIFYLIVRKKINNWSLVRINSDEKIFKNIYEIFQGIKEIKIFEAEKYVIDIFLKNYSSSSYVRRKIEVVHQLPRLWLETTAIFAFLVYFLYYLYFKDNFSNIIPLLAVFVATGFRVVTSLNRFLFNFNSIKFNSPSAEKIKKILSDQNKVIKDRDSAIEAEKEFKFYNIKFENISFAYKNPKKKIFENLNFKLESGQKIGLKGISGIGKSTFIDLFCGLLNFDSGNILINDKLPLNEVHGWNSYIGYVPQGQYLFDDTIKKNIAFGVDNAKIDNKLLEDVIRKSKLDNLIVSLPDGVETLIGDRGSKLSGGQKQRIIIARALYRVPKIIIFDESTNALDAETEQSIFENLIKKIEITSIIISHNQNLLNKYCDKVYEIENKNLRIV